MKITVTFCIDDKPVASMQSEQKDAVASLAWVKYAKKLLMLLQDRDVTQNQMIDFGE